MEFLKKLSLYALVFGVGLGTVFVAQGMRDVSSADEDALVGAQSPESLTVSSDARQEKRKAAIEKMLTTLNEYSQLPVTQLGETESKREIALNNVRLTVRGIISLIDRLEKGGDDAGYFLNRLKNFVTGLSGQSQVNRPVVDAIAAELLQLANQYQVRAADSKYAAQYNDPHAIRLAKEVKSGWERYPIPSNAPAQKISNILNAIASGIR